MKNISVIIFLICLLNFESMAQDAEAKLKEKGIELPTVSKPLANYVHVVRTGNLLFLAGKGPSKPDGSYITGKVGIDLSLEEGREAARLTKGYTQVLKKGLEALLFISAPMVIRSTNVWLRTKPFF